MSFSKALIGDLTNIRTGKLDANAASPDGKYPFFTCAQTPLKIDRFAYDCDAILVAGNGDLNVKHYKGKFEAYQRTYIIEVANESRLDSRYLYYFMSKYVEKLREMSIGGVIKYIKLGMLSDAEIPLPPLSEQKRIAAILDKADTIRRKRQTAIKLADDFLRATFLDMFGDPVINSKKWDTIPLEKIIITGPQNGLYRPSTDYGSGTPILRIDSFYDGQIKNINELKRVKIPTSMISAYQLKAHDIVINRVNSRKFLGKSAIVSEINEPTVFESNMMRLSVNEEIVLPKYLIDFLQTEYIRRQVLTRSRDAVNQSSINQEDVKTLEIRLPPIRLQKKYAGLVQIARHNTMKYSPWQNEAENLFRSLTKRAFRGEL